MANAPVLGFAVDVDISSANRALEILARLQSMAGGVAVAQAGAFAKVTEQAALAGKRASEASEKAAKVAISASEAKANAEKKFNDLAEQYSKKATAELIDDMQKLQREKEHIAVAMAETVDKYAKAELKSEKDAIAERLRSLKLLANDRKEVQNEGAGGKVGILGTGRQMAGGAGTALKGAAGALLAGGGIMAFQAIQEKAAIADKALDTLSIAYAKAGLSAGQASAEMTRSGQAATKIADEFAMPKHEIQAIQATIAGFGGITGPLADKLTAFAIGASNALDMPAEAVAKIIAKGADEEQQGKLAKLGVVFDKNATAAERMAVMEAKFGPAVQAAKDSTQDAAGAMDRIMNAVTETTVDLAASLFEALKPAFDAILPVVKQLGPILGNVLGNAMTALGPVISSVAAALAQILPVAGQLMAALGTALTPILGVVGKLITDLAPVIGILVNALAQILIPVLNLLSPLLTIVAQILSGVLLQAVKILILPIEWLSKAVQMVSGYFSGLAERWDAFSAKITGVFRPALDAISRAWEAVQGAMKKVGDYLGTVWNKIVETAIAVFNRIRDAVMAVVNVYIKLYTWIFQGVTAVAKFAAGFLGLGGIVEKVVGWITQAYEAIRKVVGAVTDFLGITGEDKEIKAKVTVSTEAKPGTPEAAADPTADPKATAPKTAKSGKTKTAAELAKEEFDKYAAEQKRLLDEKIALIERDAILTGQAEDVTSELKLQAQQKYNGLVLQKAKEKQQLLGGIERDIAKADADIEAIKFGRARITLDEQQRTESELLQDSTHTKEEEKLLELIHKEELLDLARKYGQNTLALEKEVREAKRAQLLQSVADAKEAAKKASEVAKEIRRREVDLIKDDGERAIAQENDRYDEEVAKFKDNARLKELAELDHQRRLDKIRADADARKLTDAKSLLTAVEGLTTGSNKKRIDTAAEYLQKEHGIEGANFLLRKGQFKQFLNVQLQQLAINKGAELAIWIANEFQKTAVTEAGVFARIGMIAVEIGQHIASAAMAAFNGAAQAIRWVSTVIPFPFSLAAIPVAVGAVYAAYRGAKSLFKFADGGVVTRPQQFAFGAQGQHAGLRGEAGEEAIIPLGKYPGMRALLQGSGGSGDGGLGAELRGIRKAVEGFDSRPRITVREIEDGRGKYAKKKQLVTY